MPCTVAAIRDYLSQACDKPNQALVLGLAPPGNMALFLEQLGIYWGYIGDILGLYWGYIGIMEKKMETNSKV